MHATVLLGRSVDLSGGLAAAEGLGWSVTSADSPMAVLIAVNVPWAEVGQHHFALELFDDDGLPVRGPRTDTNEVAAIRVEGEFIASPSPYAPARRDARVLMGVSWEAGELPLEPGPYEWRVHINGLARGYCQFDVVTR